MKIIIITENNIKEIINIAAKVCYSKKSITEIYSQIENSNHGISIGLDYHHYSLFEHVYFTILIEDISRSLSHQLVRHRLATYHQSSQRNIKVEDLKSSIVIPETIDNNEEAKNIFMENIKNIQECYEKLIELNIPKEDARYILPNATKTQLIMTVNVRTLIHILTLRCCNKAMPEFRKLADMILKECRKILPEIFNFVGPSCFFYGKCPEGKRTCGKFNEVIQKYSLEELE